MASLCNAYSSKIEQLVCSLYVILNWHIYQRSDKTGLGITLAEI
jgi:hypothetical protein